MRLAAAIMCGLVLTAGAAQAQSLYLTGVTDGGMIVSERDSLSWRNGNPRINVHQIYTTPVAFEKDYGGGYDWIQRSAAEYEIDCRNNQSRTHTFKFYTFEGRQSGGDGSVSEWSRFGDTSVLRSVRDLACDNTLPGDTYFDSLAHAAYVYYDVMNNPDDE